MNRLFALATPIAVAVAVAGCGGEDKKVSMTLSGGTGNENRTECAKQAPFEIFRDAPADVRYSGRVQPAPDGRFKIKVKLKRCRGNEYVDTAEQKIVGLPGGRFQGRFPIAEGGAYFLRAQLQGGDTKPRSEKLYVFVGAGE